MAVDAKVAIQRSFAASGNGQHEGHETVFVDELHAALDVVEASESARALVTVGADKHYSNGFDIDFLGSLEEMRIRHEPDALRLVLPVGRG